MLSTGGRRVVEAEFVLPLPGIPFAGILLCLTPLPLAGPDQTKSGTKGGTKGIHEFARPRALGPCIPTVD